MKCVNCKHCLAYEDGYYYCHFMDSFEAIEECVANDDNIGCDLYEQDCHDDFAEE